MSLDDIHDVLTAITKFLTNVGKIHYNHHLEFHLELAPRDYIARGLINSLKKAEAYDRLVQDPDCNAVNYLDANAVISEQPQQKHQFQQYSEAIKNKDSD